MNLLNFYSITLCFLVYFISLQNVKVIGSFPLKEKRDTRITSIVVIINFYAGKSQFQEDHTLPQATPYSLKQPLTGPSEMAGSHLSKLIRTYKISLGKIRLLLLQKLVQKCGKIVGKCDLCTFSFFIITSKVFLQ